GSRRSPRRRGKADGPGRREQRRSRRKGCGAGRARLACHRRRQGALAAPALPRVMSNRILITGGAGFVGYHLAERLSANPNASVTLLDNLSRGRRDVELDELLRRSNVDLVVGDLTDLRTWRMLPPEYDEVYHLAAIIGVKHVLR